MRGGAKEVRKLAGEPAPTTVLQLFMGNVQRSYGGNNGKLSQWLSRVGGQTGKDDGCHHKAALCGV